MVCLALFIIILTTVSKVTSLHCSHQQLLASGDDHLQQVTTLQYCLLDNCTIMMINTGEELDIVYTTDSLIVTTPTDGHTTVVITKQDKQLPCPPNSKIDSDQMFLPVYTVINFLTMAVAVCILIVHLMFKELRNIFGKLIMLNNVAVVCVVISNTSLVLATFLQGIDQLAYCYTGVNCLILSGTAYEVSGACILNHIFVTMRRSYKMRSQVSKDTEHRHFRRYATSMVGIILLVLFLVICYDVTTNNYKDVVLPNGQCISTELHRYRAAVAPIMVNGIV